jgi:ribonuclease HI
MHQTLGYGSNKYVTGLIGRVQSNMRAEFTAVIEGLKAMRLSDDGCRKVIVYSDCKGVVEACNGGIERRRMFGWRHTKNCDLWKLLEYEVSWWGDRLDVKHVYAHTKTI